MFRDPFGKSLARNAGEASRGLTKTGVPSKLFSEIFGKSIDGPKRECSLERLSPKKGPVL
jgi:hypothetical protein